jgi:entericidin A
MPKGEKLMVRKIIVLIALSSSLALAACNTVKGAGEDVQSVGEAGDKAT